MKVCLAQIRSIKGSIPKNIEKHLTMIKQAADYHAQLVVFPELSITNYEPTLARALVKEVNDPIFDPFQHLSDQYNMAIGVGMPLKVANGITIGMIIFRPFEERVVHAKETLHVDELPYFVTGNHPASVIIHGSAVAFGICYETMKHEHFTKAADNHAEIYIASVAKSDRGVHEAFVHFPQMAKEFKMPVLMSNAVGACDDFISNGKSAVWNEKGDQVDELDEAREGFLIYDSDTGTAVSVYCS